ncbi:TetR/AcrR family transcriptional regulator [Paenarthrobacter sp. PH39-S1]|uniref:TetR/AcrR family transcriptional regulator n=1 Tax=Paenarthrobacter sp. PH39-S1 TaxID=3046204 RepID=UPI0024BAF95E|nr:TetR/AcrR family transcriptional regulator [Paenarthrobacter sp. PH39-S1]MDJ0354872.1 WHG domain-containing protein [Paenarthrobacter sp. PH39-S1]
MARPKIHDRELRLKLLAAAAELLASQGAEAFSLRQLASVAGTSTTAVYSLFGGKPQLLEAVIVQGFADFGAAQASAADGAGPSAVVRLRALGRAYRRWALDHPALFTLMFSGALVAYIQSPEAQASTQQSILPLVDTIVLGQNSGELRPDDPETVAMSIWGTVHGLATLELAGMKCNRPDWDSVHQASLEAGLRAWRAE